jgi:hypothetical protein
MNVIWFYKIREIGDDSGNRLSSWKSVLPFIYTFGWVVLKYFIYSLQNIDKWYESFKIFKKHFKNISKIFQKHFKNISKYFKEFTIILR